MGAAVDGDLVSCPGIVGGGLRRSAARLRRWMALDGVGWRRSGGPLASASAPGDAAVDGGTFSGGGRG